MPPPPKTRVPRCDDDDENNQDNDDGRDRDYSPLQHPYPMGTWNVEGGRVQGIICSVSWLWTGVATTMREVK